ncbi:hypothetical protein RB614_36450 [Phytohabitans sp. ZYX-F-186]|uniref:Uncharacterized protein n=1 Tax=Phytohabitans maris TaxID=3071409 RepID=A0ABU0ZSJ8_9ACTN|nr:hypothetical protein [Phytohabitans sp. ZYX-F-186]MDQ7910003.1 hypothetical protein [Phytohabitans sp. ZYX-F-186]
MAGLEQLMLVPESDAVACVGASARVLTDRGVTYAVGPSGSVVVLAAHDDPTRSGVWNAERWRLLGPVPDVVEAILNQGAETSRHLFVRLGQDCLYLGTTARCRTEYADGRLTVAELSISPALSYEVLDRVRPPAPVRGLPGVEWLDQLPGDRVAALRTFLTGWFPALRTVAGLPVGARTRVPAALAAFYWLAHHHPALLGSQNRILPAHELHVDQHDGRLVFGAENQGVFQWTLDQGPDDPVVWMVDGHDGPVAMAEPLSGFLVQFSLFETAIGATYRAAAWEVPEPVVSRLTSSLAPVPLLPWRCFGLTSFHVAPGLIACVTDTGNGLYEVTVGAWHRALLRPLAELGDGWQRFDG